MDNFPTKEELNVDPSISEVFIKVEPEDAYFLSESETGDWTSKPMKPACGGIDLEAALNSGMPGPSCSILDIDPLTDRLQNSAGTSESNSAVHSGAFMCHHCHQGTTNKSRLKNHIIKQHLSSLHHRPTIIFKNIRKSEAMKKKRTHCPFCDYIDNSGHLKRHIAHKHTKVKPHSCPYCEFSSVTSNGVKRHVIAKHIADKTISCPYCDHTTSTPNALKLHVSNRHIPQSCLYCDYSTIGHHHLKVHIETSHKSELTLSCVDCEYKTYKERFLNRHIKEKHSTEKRFPCPDCEYRARTKDSLKKHTLCMHSNVRLFQCQKCEFTSIRKSHLRTHTMVEHFNAKLYTCSYCKYFSLRRCTVKTHIKAVHSKQKQLTKEVSTNL